MTREERQLIIQECTQLIYLYANLNDEARWGEVAQLYMPDGVFYRPSAPDSPIVGREAILDGFMARPPRLTSHHCSNVVVTPVDPETATAFSLVTIYGGGSSEQSGVGVMNPGQTTIGSFKDVMVRVAGQWLFAERRGVLVLKSA